MEQPEMIVSGCVRTCSYSFVSKVLSADSMEELVKLVEDFNYLFVSDTTMTEAEKGIGSVIDFKG